MKREDDCNKTSYCDMIDKFEGQGVDWVTADGRYTESNKDRVETLKQLGGLTTLSECDKSHNWYLRWWLARYDFQSALNIATECYKRQLDLGHTDSPHEYHLMQRSLKSIYGPLADYVHLLE